MIINKILKKNKEISWRYRLQRFYKAAFRKYKNRIYNIKKKLAIEKEKEKKTEIIAEKFRLNNSKDKL